LRFHSDFFQDGIVLMDSLAKTLGRARTLRKSMTAAERILWKNLRRNGLEGWHFRRQAPVGPYIADFLCTRAGLIVELDGAPHDREDQQLHDAVRDAWLTSQGYRVLRLPNELVLGTGELALQRIRAELSKRR
jgi:very-short-patch-repair endonuclease